MPRYVIQNLEGKTFEVEGEDYPTEEELNQISQELYPMPSAPRLEPGATLRDVLTQPEIVPAVRIVGGGIAQGQPGDTHPDIIEREELTTDDIDQRGFLTPGGEFLDRRTAAQVTGLPTEREPGNLHSTDLPAYKAEQGERVPDMPKGIMKISPPGTEEPKPWLESPTMLAQLPETMLGMSDTARETARELQAAREKVTPEERSRMIDEIETVYRAKAGMLAEMSSVNPARAHELGSLLERWKTSELAALGIESVGLFGKTKLGEPLTQQQQELLFGKGRTGRLIGIAQRQAQGLAETFVQPEMMPMLPGVAAAESRLLPVAERFARRLAGKPGPMAETGHIIGKSFLPSMAEETVALSSQAMGQLSAGDYEAAMESGVGAVTTAAMLAMPVRAAMKGAEMATRRRFYEEKPVADQLKEVQDELSSAEESDPKRIDLMARQADLQQRLDLREAREAEVEDAFKGTGREFNITDEDLGRGVIGKRNKDGSISISRRYLHLFLELEAKGHPRLVSKAIQSLVNQEVIHAAIPDAEAGEFWKLLSPAERKMEESLYPFEEGAPDWIKGQEALRRRIELANGLTPGEYFVRGMEDRLSAKASVALLRAISATRESLALTGKSKAKLARQIEILNNAQQTIIDARKGKKDALVPETAQVLQPLRDTSGKGEKPVSVKEAIKKDDARRRAETVPPPAAPEVLPVAEKAPPVTKPQEAPPPAPVAEVKTAEVAGAKPPAATEPVIPETKPAAEPVKVEKPAVSAEAAELKRLSETIRERDLTDEEMARFDELMSKKAAGPAMRMKEDRDLRSFFNRGEAEDYLLQLRMQNPRGDYRIVEEGGRSRVVESVEPAAPTAETEHGRAIAEQLGLTYRGTIYGKDQYAWSQRDEHGMSQVTFMVDKGSPAEVVKAKLQERINQGPAMKMREEDLPERIPGDRLVTLEHDNPDGTTTRVIGAYNPEKIYDLTPIGKGKIPQVGRIVANDWSHGPLRPGERIIDDNAQSALQEPAPAMRLIDMDEKQAEDYMRPMLMAAGDDPAAKQAVYDHVRAQIAAEQQAEMEANQPKIELQVGPNDPPSPTKKKIHAALEDFLNEPITSLGRVETPEELAAYEKLTPEQKAEKGAVTAEYDFPSFRKFVRFVRNQIPGTTEDSLRDLWIDKTYVHLLNASGKRLAEWRKALKLEGKRRYGTREIADPPIEVPEELLRAMTAEERQSAKERMEDLSYAEMTGIVKATSKMSDKEMREYLEDFRRRKEGAQKYRRRLITEIHTRLAAQARREIRTGILTEITPGDIDFKDSRARKLGAYHEFDESESRDVRFLQNWLDERARTSEHGTRARTRRVTVLVNRKTGQVELVSTYKHSKWGIMLYDPILAPGADKTHHMLRDVMPQYRVKASILLHEPVQNFHQRITENKEFGRSAEEEFDDKIGTYGRPAEKHLDKIWQDFQHEVQTEEEAAAAERAATGDVEPSAGLTAREREHLVSWEGATEPPETAVSKAEGDIFQGPYAETIRAQAGILRSNLKYFSRGPMTTAEARGLYWLLDQAETGQFSDMRELFGGYTDKSGKRVPGLLSILSQQMVLGKRRGLRGDEYCALAAIDKAIKKHYFELRERERDVIQPRLDELNRPIDEMKARLKGVKDKEARERMLKSLEQLVALKNKYLEGEKSKAMYIALNDLYAKFEKAREAVGVKPKEGEIPEKHDLYEREFITAALDRYGDTTRRTFESVAAQEVAAPESGARTLLLGEKRPGVPRVPVKTVPPVPLGGRMEPAAPATLPPVAEWAVRRGAEQRYGPRAEIPPGALEPFTLPKAKPTGISEYRTRPSWYSLSPTEKEIVWRRERAGRAGAYIETPRELKGPGVRVVTKDPAMRMREEEGPDIAGPAMKMKGYGISRRSREERAMEGRVIPVEPGEGISPSDSIERGRRLIAEGVDPEEVLRRFEQDPDRRINDDDIAVIRAHGEQLQKISDEIEDAEGRKSENFRKAFSALSRWDARTQPMQTVWAKAGKAQQGETDVNTGSFTAMQRAFEEDFGREFTEEEAEEVKQITRRSKKLEEEVKQAKKKVEKVYTEPEPMEPQVQSLANEILAYARGEEAKAWEELKKRYPEVKGPAMKMPEGPAMKLRDEDIKAFATIGASRMTEMSVGGSLTFSRWEERMRKDLSGFLPKEAMTKENFELLFHEASKLRKEWVGLKTGAEKAFEPVKKVATRRDVTETMTAGQVRDEIAKMGSGHPTPQQARAVWNYVRREYLDKGETEYPTIVAKVARDWGTSMENVHRILAANKTARVTTTEMYKKMAQYRRVVDEAKNWLKNKKYPKWEKWARRVPRIFFIDKIFGHGYVPQITHSAVMLFDPRAWKAYFPAWMEMYKMGRPTAAGEAYHQQRMQDLQNDKNYWLAKRAGLQNDPFKYTDDYRVVAIHEYLRHFIGNRSFDSLKLLRQTRFNQLWDGTPDQHKYQVDAEGKFVRDQNGNRVVNLEMARLWADSVNHATGIVKTALPGWLGEASSWTFFAPKLEASRWAYMIGDPAKATGIFLKWNRSSPAQRHWAMSELAGKAWLFGMYASLLAMNQGFLSMVGSKQDINVKDPRRGDFLAFKVAGFNIGVVGPIIGMWRMFARMYTAATAKRRGVDLMGTRQEDIFEAVGRYGRGKLSPFASFGLDVVTKEDYRGAPLPWSHDRIPLYKRRQGIKKYDWGYWIAETAAPIPAEEAIREIWRAQGMGKDTIDSYLKALGVAGVMAGTGARVTEDVYADIHRGR